MKTTAASGGRALTELRGQFRGNSDVKMMDCLAKLGRDVRIVVGPARRAAGEA